ncbi:MAG: response regulator [Chlorobi bacterium]|nr:response regulator [Chlorobiota bacterium]
MKLDILFVDDEVNVVHGLKRMLRPLRNEWNFYFAYGGKEALEIMKEHRIDVIVSDMIMPEMSGAELLEKVKEKYPSVIRYILSGYSKEAFALQSAKTAHQFIAKPIAPEELKEKITRSRKLHSIHIFTMKN